MVVVFINEESKSTAESLAQRFSLPTVNETPQGYYLCYSQGKLQLKDARQSPSFSIQIDIDKEIERLRLQKINYKKDLLCRAMGYKGEDNYQIFDGTLGFGKDALHMASVGCKIIACEQESVVFALMEDALMQTPHHADMFRIHFGDSNQFLEKLTKEKVAEIDCLYLDPMFEDVRKKSPPKKQMAFLREIATNFQDPARIMELWSNLKIKRMVVKRAIKSDYLIAKPNLTFSGNLIRYDVYTR